jgi:hypothetical protein
VSTFTEISLSTESSPNGLAMVIPGGSLVSNIIIANVLKLFGSLSAATVVSIPRSLQAKAPTSAIARKRSFRDARGKKYKLETFTWKFG